MKNADDCIKTLKKLEIEFEDESGEIFYITSDIKKRDKNKLLITAPVYNNCGQALPLNSRINILARTQDSVFTGLSDVTGIEELNKEEHYWITYPVYNQFLDQRKCIRIPMSVKIKVLVFKNVSKFIFEELDFHTRDISPGGFSFLSESYLKNDYEDMITEIYFEDGIIEPLVAKCSYVYTKSIEIWSSSQTKYINAVSFKDLEPKQIERIQKASFKFQLNSKKGKVLTSKKNNFRSRRYR